MDQVHELVQCHFTDGLGVDRPKSIHKNVWPQVSVAAFAFASTLSEMLINDTHYAAQSEVSDRLLSFDCPYH